MNPPTPEFSATYGSGAKPSKKLAGINFPGELMSDENNRLRRSMGAATGRTKDAGKGVLGAAGRLSRTTAGAVGNTAASSAGFVQSASQGLWSRTVSLAAQLQQLPADAVDTLLPECPVPMFIVPKSPDLEDYCLFFRLDEMFENLRSGILVRPKIEAWAATDAGWDVERLGAQLETEFSQQFQQEHERFIKSREIDVKKLERNLERKSSEMSSRLGRAGSSLAKAPIYAGAGALSLNPLTGAFTWPAGLIFLGMALDSTNNVVAESSGFLKARSMRKEGQRELKDAGKDLDEAWKEFDEKNKAFREAVSNLEIKAHPHLQEFYRLICDRGRVAWAPPTAAVATNVPDVRAHLADRNFLKKLPRRYRKLAASV